MNRNAPKDRLRVLFGIAFGFCVSGCGDSEESAVGGGVKGLNDAVEDSAGEKARAEKMIEKPVSTERDPAVIERADARLAKVIAGIEDGDFEGALLTIDEVIADREFPPVYHLHRAACLKELGRYEEATESLELYTATESWNAETREGMADLQTLLGNDKAARENAEKGLQLDRDAFGCFVTLVGVLESDEMNVAQGYAMKTSDPALGYEVALVYLIKRDQHDKAVALLKHFREDFPESDLVRKFERAMAAKEAEALSEWSDDE